MRWLSADDEIYKAVKDCFLSLSLSFSFAQHRQPWYYGWGFNLPRGQTLLDKWNQIPDSTDILLTHCPPLGKSLSLSLTHTGKKLGREFFFLGFVFIETHTLALRVWQMEWLQQAGKACSTEMLFAVRQIPLHTIKHTQTHYVYGKGFFFHKDSCILKPPSPWAFGAWDKGVIPRRCVCGVWVFMHANQFQFQCMHL